MTTTGRKPRIALMGEFSAGKSTLSNLLLGARPLPEKVTATRLSPVWMSHGTTSPYRVDVDGTEEPIQLENLESIDVDATRVIRLFFETDILRVCDLIDFPGISDPNMSSDVWQRMLGEVDAVLWCTHATQAWRQSEAAVWETIPDEVRQRSVLLITRFDKLTTDRDKYRVVARLGKETKGLFGAMFPISLTEALAAGDDYEAFTESGGAAVLEHLIPLVDELAATVGGMDTSLYQSATGGAPGAQTDRAASVAPSTSNDMETASQPVQVKRIVPSVAIPAPEPVMDAIAEPKVETPVAPTARTAVEAPTDALARAMSQSASKPAGLSNFAASVSADPSVSVDSAEPVLSVDSSEPVIAAGSEEEKRILPRRIRAEGGGRSLRPQRPQATGQVVDMTDSYKTQSARPTSVKKTVQLRSIFNEDTDEAASS